MSGANPREVQAVEPLSAPPDVDVLLPGSKSLTNRALLVAALASGTSTVRGILRADDTEAMLSCIRALGAGVDVDWEDSAITVVGTGGTLTPGPVSLFANQSGVTGRFITAAVLAGSGSYIIDGAEQLRARPMHDLVGALRTLGATVVGESLPLTVNVDATVGGRVALDAKVTSQFASGLMMVGAVLPEGIELDLGDGVVSVPYLDMTIAVMQAFGADARRSGSVITVGPGGYTAQEYQVEPDASAASYFWAAAAMTRGRVGVDGLGTESVQGDVGFVDLLERMGARIEREPHRLVVHGGALRGIVADMRDVSDTVMTLAVVAAVADGPTEITDVGFIRGKESDRIAGTVAELRRIGADAEATDNGILIRPGARRRAAVETYDDHRMAMAFALLGLLEPGVDIVDPGCVAKTFPDYFAVLDTLRSTPMNDQPLHVIAIDGPAGSGKSTIAKALARRLNLDYLDTGAMYRAVAFAAISQGIDPADADRVVEMTRSVRIDVSEAGVIVDGIDATTEIRGPEVSEAVSVVAAIADVRVELVRRQREWARRRGGGVLEGRDIGTVVFPDARLKVYLTARPEVRAERRANEATGLSYEEVAADIARRDTVDTGRDESPLTEADDAVTVDTSDLSIEGVVDAIAAHLSER